MCPANGNIITGVEWFRTNESESIAPDGIAESIPADDPSFTIVGSELRIRNVSGENEGQYSCILQVEGGQLPRQLVGCLIVRGNKITDPQLSWSLIPVHIMLYFYMLIKRHD